MEQQKPQKRRDKADRQLHTATAKEAAKQHRDVHGAELALPICGICPVKNGKYRQSARHSAA